jgi:hypothetical protein
VWLRPSREFNQERDDSISNNGMGKMQPYRNSLTDAQIKDAVDDLQTFVK